MTMTAERRVYVGTYAKYSDGSIAGKWLDLSDYADRDEFLEACRELHKDEADPELMFQDHEGIPGDLISECEVKAELWEFLELSEGEQVAMRLWLDNGSEFDVGEMRDAYAGTADSEADFCEQMAEDAGAVPEDFPSWIRIDWEGTWNASLRFDYWCERGEDGNLHFFSRS